MLASSSSSRSRMHMQMQAACSMFLSLWLLSGLHRCEEVFNVLGCRQANILSKLQRRTATTESGALQHAKNRRSTRSGSRELQKQKSADDTSFLALCAKVFDLLQISAFGIPTRRLSSVSLCAPMPMRFWVFLALRACRSTCRSPAKGTQTLGVPACAVSSPHTELII